MKNQKEPIIHIRRLDGVLFSASVEKRVIYTITEHLSPHSTMSLIRIREIIRGQFYRKKYIHRTDGDRCSGLPYYVTDIKTVRKVNL